jgi:hypothetical protein
MTAVSTPAEADREALTAADERIIEAVRDRAGLAAGQSAARLAAGGTEMDLLGDAVAAHRYSEALGAEVGVPLAVLVLRAGRLATVGQGGTT